MKNLTLTISLFLVFVLGASLSPLKTSIRINVRNELGNLEKDVKVSLYKTQADYEESKNALFSGVTDEKGNVTFNEVQAISYYIGAEKGERNNY